jgi:hypothetical protein
MEGITLERMGFISFQRVVTVVFQFVVGSASERG